MSLRPIDVETAVSLLESNGWTKGKSGVGGGVYIRGGDFKRIETGGNISGNSASTGDDIYEYSIGTVMAHTYK